MTEQIDDQEELMTRGEDALAHHGTKGMRWGVRNSRTSEILVARSNVKSKKQEISLQKARAMSAKGKDHVEQADKLKTMRTELLRNPDRVTANRMTKGEKIAAGAAFVLLPGLGSSAAIGYTGARVISKSNAKKVQKNLNRS